MKINVFVTHNNNQQLDDAERFLMDGGKIYSFTEGRKNIFHLDTLQREIKQVFDKMSPNDYLLIAGNLVISSVVTALVYSEFKKVKVLIWNYNDKQYVQETIDFLN